MDSMRHLSTSLPAREPAPAELLPDFKAAAQAVTTLYRNAATSQRHARTAGYQDALDDLLGFLDRSNLGLMDGEGWKVRQWATERLIGDGAATRQQETQASNTATDDDDESVTAKEEDKEDEDRRSGSPEVQRKPQMVATDSSDIDTIAPRRVVSEPPQQSPYPAMLPKSDFTFQSPHAYPTNHDREGNDDTDMEIVQSGMSSAAPSTSENIRIIPRSSRMNKTHGNHSRRTENRTPATVFNLGQGAGGKRKMPYQEYFDIHGLNDGSERKDGGGAGRGGKRSRNA